MQFSVKELWILGTINSSMILLFSINLLFIMHNLYKYIYCLKIYRALIILFYCLVTVSTICRIIEYLCRAINP